MKTIQLPEFIFTSVAGRQLMIRTALPQFIGEVVQYQSAEEMHQAVALLHVEHIPYTILTNRNVAIIFIGAIGGKVPVTASLIQEIAATIMDMADFYLITKQQ